jgi:hypothetical protein
MGEDPGNHRGVFDGEDERHRAATVRTEDVVALLGVEGNERRVSERLRRGLFGVASRLEKELGVIRGLKKCPRRVLGVFSAQKRRLPWPVPGRVEVVFGKKKVDPVSGMLMVHTGIDLRPPHF